LFKGKRILERSKPGSAFHPNEDSLLGLSLVPRVGLLIPIHAEGVGGSWRHGDNFHVHPLAMDSAFPNSGICLLRSFGEDALPGTNFFFIHLTKYFEPFRD